VLRVSILVVCWFGISRIGLCRSDSVGLLGGYVFGSLCWCVCVVLVVFLFWFVVLSSFFMYFVLVLVREFLYPRRCMIYFRVLCIMGVR